MCSSNRDVAGEDMSLNKSPFPVVRVGSRSHSDSEPMSAENSQYSVMICKYFHRLAAFGKLFGCGRSFLQSRNVALTTLDLIRRERDSSASVNKSIGEKPSNDQVGEVTLNKELAMRST